MRFYNTLTRKVEEFSSDNEEVKLYCCGPTVYDFAHVGNLRTFLFFDILRRTLLYNGMKVKQVINITDVDDKTIKNSSAAGMALKAYTERYTDYFFEDLNKINVQKADLYPRATENIAEMEAMVLKLMETGYAYEAEDGVYYRVSKFKNYGKLSGIKPSTEAFRIKKDEYDKDSAPDFALWKRWTRDDGDVYWDGKLPKGRPGWHIECSAMALKYLGETIDIHSGAVDLIFPHHENEIAQSESVTGKKFARYWVHPEHLLVNGEKMSKSLHNFYTLRDLEKLGFDPMSFRLLVLDAHYRSHLDFTVESLKKYEKTLDDIEIAINAFDRLKNVPEVEDVDRGIRGLLTEFRNAVNDDFNTHAALEKFFRLIGIMNGMITAGKINEAVRKEVTGAIDEMNSVLGIIKAYEVPKDLIKVAEERKLARERNEWADADTKRSVIKSAGFKIIDLSNLGYIIIKDRKYGR